MISGGWFASYQGIQLRAFSYVRTLGLDSDGSTITVLATNRFPRLALPELGEQAKALGTAEVPPLLNGSRGPQTPLPATIRHSGHLVLQSRVNGEVFPPGSKGIPVPGMVLTSITLENTEIGAPGLITFGMSDQRIFWDRGSLDIWLFNVKNHSDTPLASSEFPAALTLTNVTGPAKEFVKKRRKVTARSWSIGEIVIYAVSRLPGPPVVRRVPDAWFSIVPEFRFPPLFGARDALRRINDRFPHRVALHHDNTVGFYELGESVTFKKPVQEEQKGKRAQESVVQARRDGFAFTATSAKGKTNNIEIPIKHLNPSRGDRGGEEYGYPPDDILVVGGDRVCTIAVDYWEPILEINGDYVPLAEGAALLLRGGPILRAHERLQELTREVRLFETEDTTDKEEQERRKQITGEAAKLRKIVNDFFEGKDGTATAKELELLRSHVLRSPVLRFLGSRETRADGARAAEIFSRDLYRLWRLPGAETFSSHMLPMLDRAESQGGSRMKPLIETYRWDKRQHAIAGGWSGELATRQVNLLPTAQQQEYAAAKAEFLVINKEIDVQLNRITSTREAIAFTPRLDVEDRLTAGAEDSSILSRIFDKEFVLTRLDIPQVDMGIVHAQNGSFNAGVRAVARRIRARPELLKRAAKEGGPLAVLNKYAVKGLTVLMPQLVAEEGAKIKGLIFNPLAGRRRVLIKKLAELARPLERDILYTADLELELAVRLTKIGVQVKEKRGSRGIDVATAVAKLDEILDRVINYRALHVTKIGIILKGAIELREQPNYPMTTYVFNMPRRPDTSARIVDANRGVIRTSTPAGHIDRDDEDSVAGRRLIPRPVRVVFGTQIRPPEGRQPKSPLRFRAGKQLLVADGPPSIARTATETALAGRSAAERAVDSALVGPGTAFPYVQNQDLSPGDLDKEGHIAGIQFRRAQSAAPNDFTDSVHYQIYKRVRGSLGVARRVETRQAFAGGALPPAGASRVNDSSMREFISLAGSGNFNILLDRGKEMAESLAKDLEVRPTGTRVYRHPWPADGDGLISGTTIRSEDNLLGIETEVVMGISPIPFREQSVTQERSQNHRLPEYVPRPNER